MLDCLHTYTYNLLSENANKQVMLCLVKIEFSSNTKDKVLCNDELQRLS